MILLVSPTIAKHDSVWLTYMKILGAILKCEYKFVNLFQTVSILNGIESIRNCFEVIICTFI